MLARYFEGPVPSLPHCRAAAIISRAVKFIGWGGIADNRTGLTYASSGGIGKIRFGCIRVERLQPEFDLVALCRKVRSQSGRGYAWIITSTNCS